MKQNWCLELITEFIHMEDAIKVEKAPILSSGHIMLDYLARLVNDILEKYPAGELPPIDKMTQRSRKDIKAVIKKTNVPSGRHICTLEY